jgi:hypothetical protein
MADPANAIQREVHRLIDDQIAILRQPSFLTDTELLEYRSRSQRLENLFSVLDRIEGDKIPQWHPQLRARNRRSFSGKAKDTNAASFFCTDWIKAAGCLAHA